MFRYFGYGSNMDLRSLRAKGVEPLRSQPAALHGWRLRFNVRHFFRHEGGVGNIEPADDRSRVVHGVLHLCHDAQLAPLDAAEAHGHGYERIPVLLDTASGPQQAIAYAGLPAFIDDACLPTRRYLNILLQGASAAGLDPAYVEALRRQPVRAAEPVAPFEPPPGDYPVFDAAALARDPRLTALAGSVFDMGRARAEHQFLRAYFGGRDMTLFHLRRLDRSDGSETLDDIRRARFSPAQRRYLDAYLHAYMAEYEYAGRFVYA